MLGPVVASCGAKGGGAALGPPAPRPRPPQPPSTLRAALELTRGGGALGTD